LEIRETFASAGWSGTLSCFDSGKFDNNLDQNEKPKIEKSKNAISTFSPDDMNETPPQCENIFLRMDFAAFDRNQEASVMIQFVHSRKHFYAGLLKGSEWAFVRSFANKQIGQETWIASLRGERWFNHRTIPRYGDIARIHRYKEKAARMEMGAIPETIEVQANQEISEYPEPSLTNWTGDLKEPMEKIHLRTQRPLPNGEIGRRTLARIFVELAVPSIEILSPIMSESLDTGERPRLVRLEEVRWKSDFQPDLWGEKMKKWRRNITSTIEFRGSSSKMLQSWNRLKEKEKYATLIEEEDWEQTFYRALRMKQSGELDELDLKWMRNQVRDVDFQLALLLYYNDEITREERMRRLDTLLPKEVDRAWRINMDETPDDIESDTWVLYDDEFAALEDIPKTHVEKQRGKALKWLEEQKSEWNDDMWILRQKKISLPRALAHWYQWRVYQRKAQAELDQAKAEFVQKNAESKKVYMHILFEMPKEQ
jgi:hypothetical protein